MKNIEEQILVSQLEFDIPGAIGDLHDTYFNWGWKNEPMTRWLMHYRGPQVINYFEKPSAPRTRQRLRILSRYNSLQRCTHFQHASSPASSSSVRFIQLGMGQFTQAPSFSADLWLLGRLLGCHPSINAWYSTCLKVKPGKQISSSDPNQVTV